MNRGEELNEYKAEKLEHEKFYVFGAGDIGRGLYVTLSFFGMFAGFIDNDVQKQKNGFVISRCILINGFWRMRGIRR